MPKLNDEKKIERLKSHLETLENGSDVSKRDMKSLMTADQMECYANWWEQENVLVQSLEEIRDSIASYEALLKKADHMWSRYENTRAANKKAKTEYAAQGLYERALERLSELVDADPSIEAILDRPFPDNTVGPSACCVPRYIYSRSHYADTRGKPTKRDAKISAIESAIDDLENPKQEPTEEEEKAREAAELSRLSRLNPNGPLAQLPLLREKLRKFEESQKVKQAQQPPSTSRR